PRHLGGVGSLDGDLVAPHPDVGIREGSLDLAEVLVALADETRHEVVPGNDDIDVGVTHGKTSTSGARWRRLGHVSSTLPAACPRPAWVGDYVVASAGPRRSARNSNASNTSSTTDAAASVATARAAHGVGFHPFSVNLKMPRLVRERAKANRVALVSTRA